MLSTREVIGGLGNLMFKEAYIYAQMRDGQIPDLYVQSPHYFSKYADEIKQRFGQSIIKMPYVAIHVRRGDYVGNPFYVDLSQTDYYERAMKEFPNATFMVFSDDIDWCMKQDVFKDCLFSKGKGEVKDLNDMASCIGHIIANSSFSWWAAFLSPHGGKVVSPKLWHPDGVERTILPDKWIRI